MKNRLSLLFILTFFPIFLFAQNSKHSLFILGNYNISIVNSLYVNFLDPHGEIWSQADNYFSYGGGYTYLLNDYLGVGLHAEGEKIQFQSYYFDDDPSANRIAFGMHFQTKYPVTNLHSVVGGFINYGNMNSKYFDNNISGIEYGVFIGPGYSIKDYELSVLIHPKFSYFFSNEINPESGLLLYPRVSLKLCYSVNK